MHLILVILLSVIVFVVQLMLCIGTKKTHIRALPAMVITALIALCGIIYVAAENIYGASFVAVIEVVILAILLAVDGLGWLTYCLIRFIQKVR